MNKLVEKTKELVKNAMCSRVAMSATAMAVSATAMAQSQAAGLAAGKKAIEDTATLLKDYIPTITGLCYVLAGVVAILGAFSVYMKMNNEEQDVKKNIMMIVGACVFFIAAAKALPLFFGL